MEANDLAFNRFETPNYIHFRTEVLISLIKKSEIEMVKNERFALAVVRACYGSCGLVSAKILVSGCCTTKQLAIRGSIKPSTLFIQIDKNTVNDF